MTGEFFGHTVLERTEMCEQHSHDIYEAYLA